MKRLALRLLTRDYDCLAPLACHDVIVESVDLKFDRTPPMTSLSSDTDALNRTQSDRSVHAGELSFSRHLSRIAGDDRSFVGIPFFVVRGFKHRSFLVRRGSGLEELKALEGKRVGIVGWSATGNVWSRAALREQGVRVDRIHWYTGDINKPALVSPQETLPSYVQSAPPNRALLEMLLAGEIDAITCNEPPAVFFEPSSPIVRLLPDPKRAEQDYYRRTKVYPAHHMIGIRREVFDQDPWVARSLYVALEQSRMRWYSRLRQTMGLLPWLMGDMEETQALMGRDWQASGIEPNRVTIQTLCDEMLAQGLVARPIDGEAVFAEFQNAMER